MEKRLFVLFIVFYNTGNLYAQWTEKDSLWLQEVLSGKEQIRLNPETMKAIESGSLINNSDAPKPELLSAPPILPISKDFDLQLLDSTGQKEMDPSKVPPAVYLLYKTELGHDSTLLKNSGAFKMPDLRNKDWIQLGNSPVSVALKADNVYNKNVKDGYTRGGVIGTTRISFSLNDILMGIFSKEERAKRRNRKKANAWKVYDDYPVNLEWKKESEQ